MINNPVLQGDMHSDTIIWREEPKGQSYCVLFISHVCSAVQAVLEASLTSPVQPGGDF